MAHWGGHDFLPYLDRREFFVIFMPFPLNSMSQTRKSFSSPLQQPPTPAVHP